MFHRGRRRPGVIARFLYLIGEALELLHLSAASEQDEKILNQWKAEKPR